MIQPRTMSSRRHLVSFDQPDLFQRGAFLLLSERLAIDGRALESSMRQLVVHPCVRPADKTLI
jgi:hypothetical protein